MKNHNNLIYLILILGLTFILFIIFKLNGHVGDNEKLVKRMITKEAISHFETIVAMRQWNSDHGGVFVTKKDLKPNRYLKDNTLKDEHGNTLIKINPAWMTRQISEISNKNNNNYYKITSLKPLNPVNKPDKFEKKALSFLESNPLKRHYYEFSKDNSTFHFLGSLTVQESCLKCHKKQGYKVGDIRGGIRISIPTHEYFGFLKDIISEHHFLVTIIVSATSALALLSLWFIKLINDRQRTIESHYQHIEKLQEENETVLSRLNYAVQGTQDGLWDWNLLTNEIYFSANWKAMLGYEDFEIENKLEEWDIRVHPDDKEQAIIDIEENQKGLTGLYKNIHRLKHKNGNWIWILDRGKTHFNKEGKAIRMVGFHTNITELKNLEHQLKETQEELTQLKTVIESAPLSVVITDINANIIYVNPHFSEVTGYSKDEILGENPRILKNEQNNSAELYKDLWETVTNKETWGGIFRNKKKDGSEFWETATIVPVLDEQNRIANYLGIMREITKEVYLEKQLKEKDELMLAQSKNAAMGEMISMIAHQWRQPITAISMSANNIIADIDLEMFDTNETREIAQNIAQQTQFLSKTIDDFRNFFKKDKELETITITKVLDEIDSIILASLKNNDVALNRSVDEELTITTYPRELTQVLLNLIKNAKEAFLNQTISNKTIQVTVFEQNEQCIIKVEDNAGGIPEENMEKIFEPYFTTKEEYNGTGLGLYMSKMIIEKHLGGKLSVTNKNGGASFTIEIPKMIS